MNRSTCSSEGGSVRCSRRPMGGMDAGRNGNGADVPSISAGHPTYTIADTRAGRSRKSTAREKAPTARQR
jgi:hypothetical protein